MTHDESLKPGSSLADGRFIVDKLIAKGGFSYIYEGRIIYRLALDNEFVSIKAEEKPVVIKELYISEKSRRESDSITLRWNDENEPDEKNRLSYRIKNKTRNEALKLRLLTSPYILKLIGAFEENNTIYQITEKIEGAVDFHKRQGLSAEKIGTKLSVFDAIRYITQISEALKEVHGKNIVHLDIKPENILCDYKDNAILIDFGISMTIGEKTGRSTVLSAASRPWAPPEQYNTKDTVAISFASDIYSLGQTFYAFLTGVIPPDFSEVTSGSAILQSPSEYNKDVTDYLDEVVIKCIQSKRDKRYQTIEEFLFALQGEDDYKVLIDKAQKAEQNEEYEQAIHLLNESEKYIPLSSDLLELRYEYQNKLKQQQNERENKQKEEEALKLIHDGDFENALSILELLPFNAHIRQQMEKCRQGISLRKKTELIAEAENLIGKKQYENALSKYQEAKVIDQSDVAIDRSIEELQKILQDIEKNKKYNEFIAIGDKAFEDNEFEKALEAYKLAKDNVTLSSLTIDKRIETCVIALSERDEREKAKDAVANALAKVKDKPLLEIAEQELATEIEHNIGKLRLIEDFRVKYALSDAFHTEFLTSQARAKELEQLRLYFEAKTENDKRAYDVALKILADVTSPTLKESVISLQKKIKNAQDIAKVEALKKEIKELIKKNDFHVAKNKLIEIEKVDKLLSASLQTTLDHKKLIYATSLNDEGDCKGAISLLQTIGAQSPSYNEAQKILDAINKKKVADNETTIIEQAKVAINKKNYQAATTLLNAIPNSSTSYDQVTQLFSTIDKELFDNAKSLFERQDWQNASNAFNKIDKKSAYYTEAQRYIRTLKQSIETQHYQKIISDALQKVEEKKYKKARQLLAQIPAQNSVDEEKRELLQKIANAENGKRNKIGFGIIIFIVVIVILLVIGLLSKREIQPTQPASVERIQTEIEKLKADSIASENARIEEEKNRAETAKKAVQEAQFRKEKEDKVAREQKAVQEAQFRKEKEDKVAREQKIANYESEANRYKNAVNYVAAIKLLQAAQNISYSSNRSSQIRRWTEEGDDQARALMQKAIKLKIDGDLDPCNAALKAYYTEIRKLTTNPNILGMIKCNE